MVALAYAFDISRGCSLLLVFRSVQLSDNIEAGMVRLLCSPVPSSRRVAARIDTVALVCRSD
jgi:hypothetical protein